MAVIVGVDGSGRTYRLDAAAAAAGWPVVRIIPPIHETDDVAARLDQARRDGATVFVDDAHRLSDETLYQLTVAARDGIPVVIARRPTITRPALAGLDEIAARDGCVEWLRPLDSEGMADLVETVTGQSPAGDRVAEIIATSGGLPAIAAALATASPGEVPPDLAARVQRRLALLDATARRLARVLALGVQVPDATLAGVCGLAPDRLGGVSQDLRDQGFLEPEGDRLIPAIAQAILTDLAPLERRRLHHDLATALLDSGADPMAVAERLSQARVTGSAAAQAFRLAGARVLFDDPADAQRWFDEAAEAGADRELLAAGQAEAAILLGDPVDLDVTTADPDDQRRLIIVSGVLEAQQGRAGRAADALSAAGSIGRLLAVPALVVTGRLTEAEAALAAELTDVARPLRRFAEAALAVPDPVTALPLLIEAAEVIDYARPKVVLPDTPHAIGAIVAVAAGDASSGVRLLDQAIQAVSGGPGAQDRHRLLRAWVQLRSGRYDGAAAEVRRSSGRALAGRDRVLLAAITAGLARRSGDIARLRDAWTHAEPVLARQSVDLLQLEVLEELVVAAARLGMSRRAAPVLDAFDHIVERLGKPVAWSASAAWIRLQAAIATDEAKLVHEVAAGLPATAGGRPGAQRLAAQCWAEVLVGEAHEATLVKATEALAAAELPWEASRLAGQAAIRTSDPAVARRLLERARELSMPEVSAHEGPEATDILSERELDVARLILAGRTHKEIGAQLYVSPKTVEHHAARIRSKLGATTRADLVAALRTLLETNVVKD